MMKLEKGTFSVVPIKMLYGLSPACQTVFMWMCFHANDDGNCFPSVELLSLECGVGRNVIIRSVATLVKLGYLLKKRRRNKSSIYQVIVTNQEVPNRDVPNQEVPICDPGSTKSGL